MLPIFPTNIIPQLMTEGLLLRGQLACARAESARLRDEVRSLRMGNGAAETKEAPAFDWRLVLQNPEFGWSDDIVAEAKDMRDAENRRAVRR